MTTRYVDWVDPSSMPRAVAYQVHLDLFRQIAESPNETFLVRGAPPTWSTLLWYLGEAGWAPAAGYSRHRVETSCAAEPVLVDALWRADMKWSGDRRHKWEKEFPISTYSGFWRPELLRYMEIVQRQHIPTHDRCILLPCSIDKPYPSELHKKVKELAGDKYELIATSSAVGVAPETFWELMPRYDAGLPFFDRVRGSIDAFFGRPACRYYEKIVLYVDMLQHDIEAGLNGRFEGQIIKPFFVPAPRCDYLPLDSEEYLAQLEQVL